MKLGISLLNIVYRCLIRKITNSSIAQQLHKQLRSFLFEQRFHMQTNANKIFQKKLNIHVNHFAWSVQNV